MKILSVSDRVERLFYEDFRAESFKGIELILSCGDLQPEYLTHLSNVFKVPLYYVRGNHDLRYATRPPAGCTDINTRIINYKGMNILGLEGSRWYNGGPYQYTEGQMRLTVWRLGPSIWWQGGLDIVITHAPPRHIHDAEDPCHRGFRVYRRLIDKYAPRYFFHGHIHAQFTDSAQRLTMINQTTVINTYGYHLLEIDHE